MPCPAAPAALVRGRSGWSPSARASSDRRRSRPRRAVPVAGGVGERLLEDAVRGLVETGRKRPPRPRVRTLTTRPAERCRSARVSRAARPRVARRFRRLFGRSSSRRARTSWSISPSVSRATSSIVSSAACERSGSLLASSLAAPAWTRITLIAWPAESWRSRAMRVRSSAAARRRSRSASRSARRGAPRARRSARAAGGPGRRSPTPHPRRGRRRGEDGRELVLRDAGGTGVDHVEAGHDDG